MTLEIFFPPRAVAVVGRSFWRKFFTFVEKEKTFVVLYWLHFNLPLIH